MVRSGLLSVKNQTCSHYQIRNARNLCTGVLPKKMPEFGKGVLITIFEFLHVHSMSTLEDTPATRSSPGSVYRKAGPNDHRDYMPHSAMAEHYPPRASVLLNFPIVFIIFVEYAKCGGTSLSPCLFFRLASSYS